MLHVKKYFFKYAVNRAYTFFWPIMYAYTLFSGGLIKNTYIFFQKFSN